MISVSGSRRVNHPVSINAICFSSPTKIIQFNLIKKDNMGMLSKLNCSS